VLRSIPFAAALVAVLLVCSSCGGHDDQGRRGKQTETTFLPETTLSAKEMPNVLFILTDDQDLESLSRMGNVQRLLVRQGTSFDNAFATTPLCCPSRVSFMRGQYAHNHGVLGNKNSPRQPGGYEGFRELRLQDSTVATWLDDVGYKTFYAGKLLNGYKNERYVPPGWDEWYAFSGHPQWGHYEVNENGDLKTYRQADKHETYYLRDTAEAFVRNHAQGGGPWFAMVATHAPHNPHTRAPEFRDSYEQVKMPTPPSFNETDVSDKPGWVQKLPRMDPSKCSRGGRKASCKREATANTWAARLKSLKSVDVMVKDLVAALEETSQMERTYVVFASDNGFLLYRHRVYAKGVPYEEVQSVPFVVRGPGVQRGVVGEELVASIDLAPTIAEWAGIQPPEYVDGRSLVPLLEGTGTSWRRWLLFEHTKTNHPYVGVRTAGEESYVEWESGEKEYYDLTEDPWQLESAHAAPENAERLAQLSETLSVLEECEGAGCRRADGGP
jgi:N-acetylglucosamine-6-sulfatase